MAKVPDSEEKFNRLSRVHQGYRQTTDRRTGGSIMANVNVSSRSLKIIEAFDMPVF